MPLSQVRRQRSWPPSLICTANSLAIDPLRLYRIGRMGPSNEASGIFAAKGALMTFGHCKPASQRPGGPRKHGDWNWLLRHALECNPNIIIWRVGNSAYDRKSW